jgi:hypothetical protein
MNQKEGLLLNDPLNNLTMPSRGKKLISLKMPIIDIFHFFNL